VQQQQHRCLVALSVCQVSEPQPAPFCSHLGPANVPDALATLANDFIESTEAYPQPDPQSPGPQSLNLVASVDSSCDFCRIKREISTSKLNE